MTQELIERAAPLLNCGHHANRPNPRVSGERLVGFVIDQDDIGLGLSEPLLALDAVVELAKLAQSQSARITELDAQDERVREAMFVLSDRLRASGILSASDAVHKAYEAVVLSLTKDSTSG